MKRNTNGMGSIRQRSDGRWEARYTAPDGRQRSLYAHSESEVARKLRAVLHDLDAGFWRAPSRMTVAQWMEIWLRDYNVHTTGRTLRNYRDFSRLYIVPQLGSVTLTKLSKHHVRRMVSTLQQSLAPSSIAVIHAVLSAALKSAVEAGIIHDNQAKGVKLPKLPQKRFSIVDRELIPVFIEAALKRDSGRSVVFALMTGLRAGELCGLRWCDVDLDAPSINVCRQMSLGESMPPKSGSVRLIQLPPAAADLLRAQRETVRSELVFPRPDGTPMSREYVNKLVHAIGEEIGLPHLHTHDLRHSYAVAALRSGIDVKTVQHNLGHRSAAMTLDTYAAYTTDAGKTGAARFAEYWDSALEQGQNQGQSDLQTPTSRCHDSNGEA